MCIHLFILLIFSLLSKNLCETNITNVNSFNNIIKKRHNYNWTDEEISFNNDSNIFGKTIKLNRNCWFEDKIRICETNETKKIIYIDRNFFL